VAQKVTAGVYKGVTTTELDELAAETAAGMTSLHPDYAVVRVVGTTQKKRRCVAAQRARGRWRANARVHARGASALRAEARRVSAAAARWRGAVGVFCVGALRRRFVFKARACRRS
jgi:hypothetical protein